MKIVKIIDKDNYVIDQGSYNDVKIDDIFIVYIEGEEIIDPDTGNSLGMLEMPKVRCKVTHVQEYISIIHSLEAKPKSKSFEYANTLNAVLIGDTSPYNFLSQQERIVVPGDKIRKDTSK